MKYQEHVRPSSDNNYQQYDVKYNITNQVGGEKLIRDSVCKICILICNAISCPIIIHVVI